VTRHGNPISKLSIRNKLHHGITYSSRFEEWEACIAAGLSIDKWEENEYSNRLKGYVIAWYRVHNMIESHVQDASIDRAKRDAKRKRR
jgi:hypothetical protein